MNETSKSAFIREFCHGSYLIGRGIDIGAGDDPLKVNRGTVNAWDKEDGDAQYMAGVPDRSYNFVYSSHCLEHMVDIDVALENWTRILKPLGYLYIVVPDYQLYEQMRWPSIHNPDHKHNFSLSLPREKVGRDNHHSMMQFVKWTTDFRLVLIDSSLQDQGYDYNVGPCDQTLGNALAQICLIFRKR